MISLIHTCMRTLVVPPRLVFQQDMERREALQASSATEGPETVLQKLKEEMDHRQHTLKIVERNEQRYTNGLNRLALKELGLSDSVKNIGDLYGKNKNLLPQVQAKVEGLKNEIRRIENSTKDLRATHPPSQPQKISAGQVVPAETGSRPIPAPRQSDSVDMQIDTRSLAAALTRVTPGRSWGDHPVYTGKGGYTGERLVADGGSIRSALTGKEVPVEEVLRIACRYLDMPSRYQMHATGRPDSGGRMQVGPDGKIATDCAGFIVNVLIEAGILRKDAIRSADSPDHVFSRNIHKGTEQVSDTDGRPGDLLFWVYKDYEGTRQDLVGHVALIRTKNPDGSYAVIDMSSSGKGITEKKTAVRPGVQSTDPKLSIVIGRLPAIRQQEPGAVQPMV